MQDDATVDGLDLATNGTRDDEAEVEETVNENPVSFV
jgi:hypothetical protein